MKKQRKIYPVWIILGFCMIIIAVIFLFSGMMRMMRKIQVASEVLGALMLILALVLFGAFCLWKGLTIYEKEGLM